MSQARKHRRRKARIQTRRQRKLRKARGLHSSGIFDTLWPSWVVLAIETEDARKVRRPWDGREIAGTSHAAGYPN